MGWRGQGQGQGQGKKRHVLCIDLAGMGWCGLGLLCLIYVRRKVEEEEEAGGTCRRPDHLRRKVVMP